MPPPPKRIAGFGPGMRPTKTATLRPWAVLCDEKPAVVTLWERDPSKDGINIRGFEGGQLYPCLKGIA